MNQNFFFCYNRDLFYYLKSRNISYITIAKNPTTDKTFSLFQKSTQLQNALDDYKQLHKS